MFLKSICKFGVIVISLCAFLATTVMTTGCTSVNRKVGAVLALDTDLKLHITVADDINPDESKQPSPVFVRLYELNGTQAFEKADFIDLYERDEEVLGDTFVAKQELTRLVPGTERKEEFVLSKDTRYVAVFAEFFRYNGSISKVVFPVTTTNVVRNSIKIKVTSNQIFLVD